MRRSLLLAALLTATLASPGVAEAANTRLVAGVGPGFVITLSTEGGQRVTQLDPGTYDITVNDNDVEHNFHLSGPGVDRRTDVGFEGTQEWTVTLVEGNYTYVCDPHETTMRGAFRVGNPPAPPPPPPAPPPPAGAKPVQLTATVGPGFTIALLRAAKRVATLKAGAYVITVADRSQAHNFHLVGPGLDRRTSVAFTGRQTWRVTLRRGTYRFLCDPHERQMRGTLRVG